MTPGKNQGTWSVILREQSYLSGIDEEHLRPWTVKKKDEPGTVSPLTQQPLTPPQQEVGTVPEPL